MNEQVHIIIARDRGKIFRLPCSTKALLIVLSLSTTIFLIFFIAGIFSVSLYSKNRTIARQLLQLQESLYNNSKLIAKQQSLNERQQLALNLEIATLKRTNTEQTVMFAKEKEALISNAVDELRNRSEIIKRIIGSIGIKLPMLENKKKQGNTGGPFTPPLDGKQDALLYKADKYLNIVRYLPFGEPINSRITSRFGKRIDPKNNKPAFHYGIDLRAKKGDKIYATADGVVTKAFHNGNYGNYILIDHGNGYTTSFGHLQSYLVRTNDLVERGQLIGLAGNSGRSTGPHLHYEIALDKKPINPYRFLRIKELQKSLVSALEEK